MKKKKIITIIVLLIILIVAIGFGVYTAMSSIIFNADGTVEDDGKEKMVNQIKSMNDVEMRKEVLDNFANSEVFGDVFTQEELNELY